jgi:hypothetical protein
VPLECHSQTITLKIKKNYNDWENEEGDDYDENL